MKYIVVTSGLTLGGAVRMAGEVIDESLLPANFPVNPKEQKARRGKIYFIAEDSELVPYIDQLRSSGTHRLDELVDIQTIKPSWTSEGEEIMKELNNPMSLNDDVDDVLDKVLNAESDDSESVKNVDNGTKVVVDELNGDEEDEDDLDNVDEVTYANSYCTKCGRQLKSSSGLKKHEQSASHLAA